MDLTLDQLRTLEAVADAGSFSAAGRRLRRVQSAVSTAMANLEAELGVTLFDRGTKVPTITPAGRAVLAQARRILGEVATLNDAARELAGGVEAQVSLCVDSLLPMRALVGLCERFAKRFPQVDLRVDTQTLSAVAARVVDGAATVGVTIPVALPAGLERTSLAAIRMVPVAKPGLFPTRTLRPLHLDAVVQIVLSEGGSTPDQAVVSPRTWRVADLHTKHALIRAGLGWGNLPDHLVRDDLHRKRLVELRLAAWHRDEHVLHLVAIHRRDRALGPAHRWVVEQLRELCKQG
jgi:DNA-binding transcriptional LysR family regulator